MPPLTAHSQDNRQVRQGLRGLTEAVLHGIRSAVAAYGKQLSVGSEGRRARLVRRPRLTGYDGKASLYGDKMGVAHCPTEPVEASSQRLEVSNLCITRRICGWTSPRMANTPIYRSPQWGWHDREVKRERNMLFP